jgi:hypothetical protein
MSFIQISQLEQRKLLPLNSFFMLPKKKEGYEKFYARFQTLHP